MEERYMLQMVKISKSFPGVRALDNVDLKVKQGTVHALIGENGAGKSTLMKILMGLYTADSGEVFLDGEKYEIKNVGDAYGLGVSIIQQELNNILEMTIAENIFLGREIVRGRVNRINWKETYAKAKNLLEDFGLSYNCKTRIADLSISGMQMVEIVKAISRNAKLIIMDEPTSAISASEVKLLFEKIKELKKRNITIIYITHRLDEIFEVADEVTVLRDGKYVGSEKVADIERKQIISMMIGRELEDLYPKSKVEIGETLLEVKNLKRVGAIKKVTFSVRKGEILGVAGLMGSGRTELMRSIFGLDKLDEGEIWLEGKKVRIDCPQTAIDLGIVMVPEDRKRYGLVLDMSVKNNITLPNLKLFFKHWKLDLRMERRQVNQIARKLFIKMSNIDIEANSLSGGNQQKVVLAKWLLSNPKVIILDEPTRGIDVGAKAEVHKIMVELAARGVALIMISSELPEILGMSDRIIIMNEGEIKGDLLREEASQQKLMELAVGG